MCFFTTWWVWMQISVLLLSRSLTGASMQMGSLAMINIYFLDHELSGNEGPDDAQ